MHGGENVDDSIENLEVRGLQAFRGLLVLLHLEPFICADFICRKFTPISADMLHRSQTPARTVHEWQF